jgi:hypothetical protein
MSKACGVPAERVVQDKGEKEDAAGKGEAEQARVGEKRK